MRYVFCIALVLLFSVMMFAQSAHAGQPAAQIFHTSDRCMACHNDLAEASGKDISIGTNWSGSMMANSARDPYWHAGVRREITEDLPNWSAKFRIADAESNKPICYTVVVVG